MEEKNLRKYKAIFEDKPKVKARLHALYAFIDSSTETEIVDFMDEHQSLVFSLLDAGYDRQKSKIAAALNDSPDKLESFKSKHITELFNIYSCLRKLILTCGCSEEWWKSDKTLDFLVNHISKLLCYQNDHRIRLEGFRLALLCVTVNYNMAKVTRILNLILSAIILDPFKHLILESSISDSAHVVICEPLVVFDKNTVPVYPSKSSPTIEEAGECFDELLFSLIAVASKSRSYYTYTPFEDDEDRLIVVNSIFDIIRNQFLNRLFPQFHSRVPDRSGPLFRQCPSIFVRALLALLSRFSMKTSPYTCSDILNSFFFGTAENFSYTQVIMEAGFRESPSFPRTIRYSLNIVKIWMLLPLKELPLVQIIKPGIVDTKENYINNVLIQHCFNIIPLIFETVYENGQNLSDSSDIQKISAFQTAIFIEAISLFRNVVLSPCTLLEIDTCENLQLTLLKIFDSLLSLKHGKSVINGVMDYFVETLLIMWIRAATKNTDLWNMLKQKLCLALENNSVQTIIQWGKTLKSLAVLYCKYVLDIDVLTMNQPTIRSRNKSMFVHTETESRSPGSEKNIRFSPVRHSSDLQSPNMEEMDDKIDITRGTNTSDANLSRSKDTATSQRPASGLSFKPLGIAARHHADALRLKFKEHTEIYRDIDMSESASKMLSALNKRTEREFRQMDDLPFWNEHAAVYMYRQMLRVIGNINHLKDPYIHHEAFLAISSVLELFFLCKTQQPCTAVVYPPLFEFSAWFLDAIDLPESFKKSKCIAFTNICKLLLRKMYGKEDTPDPPKAFYGRAMSAIIKGFFSGDLDIISSILTESSNIFGLNIPSIHIILPTFVFCVHRWTKTELSNLSSYDDYFLKMEELNGLSSSDMCCILKMLISVLQSSGSRLHQDRILPVLVSFDGDTKKVGEISMKEMHQIIKNLILTLSSEALVNTYYDHEVKHVSLCSCTFVAFFELESQVDGRHFDNISFETAINVLLHSLHAENQQIVLSAIDCLSCFTQNSEEIFQKLPESILKAIIGKYLASISDNVYFDQSSAETKNLILSRLLYGVLDWLMILPKNIMNDVKFRTDIFETIENVVSDFQANQSQRNSNYKLSKKSGKHSKSSSRDLRNINAPSGSPWLTASTGALSSSSTEQLNQIENPVQEAAENVYLHLLHYYDNFPMSIGPATCSSYIVEESSTESKEMMAKFVVERAVVSLFDKVIVSIEIYPMEALVIIRNSVGKFGWTLSPVQREKKQLILVKTYEKAGSGTQKNKENQEPNNEVSNPSTDSDKWEAKLSQIRKMAEEDSYWNELECLSYQTKTIENEDNSESKIDLVSILNHLHMIDTYKASHQSNSVNRNLKFLNVESAGLWRDIKGLDKKSGRECIKVAVLYVGPGQEDESSILGNQQFSTSLEFQDFMNSLGWTISVDTHPGFLAGLERSGATGKYATYYCTSTLEMIFHDVTQMPNDETDVKQVKKKRHIGNDHVHIIWNDHYRPYKANTIAGDFGNMQIIITPLQAQTSRDSLFSIEVRRGGSEFFGPLVSCMVVSKYLLGRLVRLTAIHAYRSTLNETSGVSTGYRRPFHHRLNDIKMITSRHEQQSTPLIHSRMFSSAPISNNDNN